ncbi:hypothetical protein OsI_30639 [Oryza sativa Indica Group]|uniref:Uncharacterized protein n=1 Tax=Oryza sativa subsp. indica TaxID=39946 RepID=B8BDN5_ORYSI|nr:hypothetical protein OsI_30639 [Oryza sativa Indica Group]
MAKQKIVVKMPMDTERKKRKAFKAAVGMTGVTSASLDGDKLLVIGDGVDPIALTTMLRRSLGHAELLSVSSGDDKKMGGGGGGHGGMGMGFGGGHGGMGFGGGHGGKEGKEGGGKVFVDGVHHHQQQQHAMAPPMQPYPAAPAYYNAAAPSYPVYPSYPGYPQQEQDPSCSIM